jgi:hypothetical protein
VTISSSNILFIKSLSIVVINIVENLIAHDIFRVLRQRYIWCGIIKFFYFGVVADVVENIRYGFKAFLL